MCGRGRASYGAVVTTFDRLPARPRTLSPGAVDVLVVAGVGFTAASDAAVNEPGYRQADWFTWLLLAVSLAALLLIEAGTFRGRDA